VWGLASPRVDQVADAVIEAGHCLFLVQPKLREGVSAIESKTKRNTFGRYTFFGNSRKGALCVSVLHTLEGGSVMRCNPRQVSPFKQLVVGAVSFLLLTLGSLSHHAQAQQFRILDDATIGTLAVEVQNELFALQTEVSAQSVVFWYPYYRGYRVDWCLEWGSNCGQKAANIACKIYGYVKAVGYQIAYDIGSWSPTYVLADDALCGADYCDGFSYIVCDY